MMKLLSSLSCEKQKTFPPAGLVCHWIVRPIRPQYLPLSMVLERTVIENVESIKYLGVTIANDLRWNTHVSNIFTKANRTLGFLIRNLYACPQEVKEAAYKGLMRPVLEYTGSVWDPFRMSWKKFKIDRLGM